MAKKGKTAQGESIQPKGEGAVLRPRSTVDIYVLKHPDTGEIRYVGKANDAHKRLKSHIADSTRRDTPVYRWIRKLACLGLSPAMEVIETCESGRWCEVETAAIARYRSSHRLLNVAIGGDEPFCSTEQRAENGRINARAIHDNPRSRRIWELKRSMGQNLTFLREHGMVEDYNRIVGKLKIAAMKCPRLYSGYLALAEI